MNQLEESYLTRIGIHLKDSDPDDRVLKTYLDSWFAHSRGGGMLEANGKPQWANRGDLEKHDHLCDQVHAISLAADAMRRAGDRKSLVRDHTIPKAEIVKKLKELRWTTTGDLRKFLLLWFTVSILTQEEHKAMRFRSSMPRACTEDDLLRDPDARFARYLHPTVNIPFIRTPLAMECWGQ